MDDKKTKNDKSIESDGEQSAIEAAVELEARSTILEIIELAGTHTSATDTEVERETTKGLEIYLGDSRKHVSFRDLRLEMSQAENKAENKQKEESKLEQNVKRTPVNNNQMQAEKGKENRKDTKSETESKKERNRALVAKCDKVKDFVKELESNCEKDAVAKIQQLAKKRKIDASKSKQKHSDGIAQDEAAKRKRSDMENLSSIDIVIEDLPETLDEASSDLDSEEQLNRSHIEPKNTRQLTSRDDDLPVSENQEIAERFKQIMEMFDNFTKNLESLEMSSTSEDNGLPREPSPKLSAILQMERGVNDDFAAAISADKELFGKSNMKQEQNNDYIIDIEDLKRPETETFELSQLQQNTDNTLPKWRQGLQRSPLMSSSLRSSKDIATSTQLELRTATIASVSCQTSLYDQGQQQYDAVDAAAKNSEAAYEYPLHFSAVNVVLPPRSLEQKSNNSQEQQHQQQQQSQNADDCRVETYMAISPQSENSSSKKSSPGGLNIGPSISRVNLVKVSESPSMVELPVITQPYSADRTFHTIHIDTTSSPSSSVMRRPPLAVRCWHVITDLFNAICMCLQVNKDCIFCIGFFIAFVVSASFLTAFFYRTLSITPQFFHPTPPSAMQQTATGFRDTGFYYY